MDKNKLIESAAKLVAKGAYDKAIKEYSAVLKEDPKDVRVLQKMGELYQKKNDPTQAAQYFAKVAESYATDGFFLKAVALYKQVLKLDPSQLDVNLKLAELHQQLGLMTEAFGYLQGVAAHHEQKGDARASLDVLKRMMELDPENVRSREKLADMMARQDLKREAITEYQRAAEQHRRANRTDDFLRVSERLCQLEPDNLTLNRDLAIAYLDRGDQKRALARLQISASRPHLATRRRCSCWPRPSTAWARRPRRSASTRSSPRSTRTRATPSVRRASGGRSGRWIPRTRSCSPAAARPHRLPLPPLPRVRRRRRRPRPLPSPRRCPPPPSRWAASSSRSCCRRRTST